MAQERDEPTHNDNLKDNGGAVEERSFAKVQCSQMSLTKPDTPGRTPDLARNERSRGRAFQLAQFSFEQLVLGKSLDALSALALHIDVRDGKTED
jgi:hypothetical protein